MLRASCAIACTIDSERASLRMSRTKLPSIFSVVTGSWRRYESDDSPVPKSSSATPQPIRRRRRMRTSARPMFATVAFSVSSKQKIVGSSPQCSSLSIRKSPNESSLRDWPEKLMEKPTARFASSSACGVSKAMARSTTQRSIRGMSW